MQSESGEVQIHAAPQDLLRYFVSIAKQNIQKVYGPCRGREIFAEQKYL